MTRYLYDADTAEAIGPATPTQCAASDAAAERDGDSGVFLMDRDGDPVAEHDADQPYTPGPVRRVYTDPPVEDA